MWRIITQYLAFRKLVLVLVEHLLIVGCILDAVYMRLMIAPSELFPFVSRAVVMAVVFQICLHLRDVYDFHKTRTVSHLLLRLGQALLLASVVLFGLYFFVPGLVVGRGVFTVSLALIFAFLIGWHFILRLYFGVRTPSSKVVVLGTGGLARELVREILRHSEHGIQVIGFLDDDPELVGTSVVNPKVLGSWEDMRKIVAEEEVDRIIVEIEDRRGRLPLRSLLDLKTRGIPIEEATTFYERISGKIALENLKPSWMIFNSGFEVSQGLLIQKRVVSVLVSLLLLMLSAPLCLLIMALIKLDSRGSIFHKQERVGQNGKVFTFWKFRSMHENAEADTGPVWSMPGDSRVTRVGKILRRTRLDEIPQLYNVLRGDMSLVGPRPERPHFVKELAERIPFYHLRHVVKPGVTGWAQINYEYGNSYQDAVEKLQYDLFYIKHVSWLLDSLIILETIKTVLVSEGS